MADLPLLTDLPAMELKQAQEEFYTALSDLAFSLRALNGHRDLPSTFILIEVGKGHAEGEPVTEGAISKRTGIDHRSVRRRLEVLINDGEVLRVRYRFVDRKRTDVVYVLNLKAGNNAKRLRRLREAIRKHANEMKRTKDTLDLPEEADDRLPILPANGGVSPPKMVRG